MRENKAKDPYLKVCTWQFGANWFWLGTEFLSKTSNQKLCQFIWLKSSKWYGGCTAIATQKVPEASKLATDFGTEMMLKYTDIYSLFSVSQWEDCIFWVTSNLLKLAANEESKQLGPLNVLLTTTKANYVCLTGTHSVLNSCPTLLMEIICDTKNGGEHIVVKPLASL